MVDDASWVPDDLEQFELIIEGQIADHLNGTFLADLYDDISVAEGMVYFRPMTFEEALEVPLISGLLKNPTLLRAIEEERNRDDSS